MNPDLQETIDRLNVYTQVVFGDEVLIPVELVQDCLTLLKAQQEEIKKLAYERKMILKELMHRQEIENES